MMALLNPQIKLWEAFNSDREASKERMAKALKSLKRKPDQCLFVLAAKHNVSIQELRHYAQKKD